MIVINYATDIVKATIDTLKASDISLTLKATHRVAIKPNLVIASPASGGATTHPQVVEGIILFLKEYGVSHISIMEGSWVGDCTKRAYKRCGYEDLAQDYGLSLIDLKDDTYQTLSAHGYDISICDSALETDFLINVPVLKGHCQTGLTCCMKNLKGCIPDKEKRRFHSLGLHKPIATLNTLLRPGYCVVDGICGDLNFEEGGTPVVSNRILAGSNPLLIDSFAAHLIGYQPEEIGYLVHGREMGLGDFFNEQTNIVELNREQKPTTDPKSSRILDKYKGFIKEDAACSACYSALAYALYHLRGKPSETLHIGQGFRGVNATGFGIGNCAKSFSQYVPGCPPKATDIIHALNL